MDNGQPATPKEAETRSARRMGRTAAEARALGPAILRTNISPRSQKRGLLCLKGAGWSHLSLSGRDSAAEIHREEHGRPWQGALSRGRVMGRPGQSSGTVVEGLCATVYILRLKTNVGTFSLKKKKTNAWNT